VRRGSLARPANRNPRAGRAWRNACCRRPSDARLVFRAARRLISAQYGSTSERFPQG
jgi:hypothetical protein